jgi:predicted dehydrogenase
MRGWGACAARRGPPDPPVSRGGTCERKEREFHSMKQELVLVGMIGYGIGKVYAEALRNIGKYYRSLPAVELVAIATSSEASGKLAIEQQGFQRATDDYKKLLASEDINTLVIATPHYLHHEMLLAALATDKAIYTDKPLANNLREAREIVALARQRGRDAQLSFTMRYCPGVQYAKMLLQDGRLGNIYSFRLVYYRASYRDPRKSLRWKAKMATSGGGVLSDLVPHLADLLIWLVGMPERVAAQTRTFIEQRPIANGSSEITSVETDDHVIIQAALPGGPIGTIESGRLIASTMSDVSVEIYGSKASLRWRMMEPDQLYFADGTRVDQESTWQQITAEQSFPASNVPGADISANGLRFNIAAFADFLSRTCEGRTYDPGLEQGLRVQEIIEAATIAAREERWIALNTL